MVAACCTTFSFLPQAFKIIKTRDTSAISVAMYTIFTSGTLLWLAYGMMTDNLPVILANAVTSALASVILFYKLRYK